jgi:hypothetical protein
MQPREIGGDQRWRRVLQAPLVALAVFFLLTAGVRAAELDLPQPIACPAVTADLGLRLEHADGPAAWNACERFVWSCIRAGMEANLYNKRCLEPRVPETSRIIRRLRYAPFVEPDRYKEANLLRGGFLRAVLFHKEYVDQIQPPGIRIFGGYFADIVNLENIATDRNLVFDASIFRSDVRMTNFRTTANISFDGANVRSPLLLLRSRIEGSLFLQKGVYDHVDLRDARIGASLDAADSSFNGLFRLDRAQVSGKVDLERSRLTNWSAVDATINGFVRLHMVDVRARLDMTGAKIGGDVRMQKMRFGRWPADGPHKCDWNLEADPKISFGPEAPGLKGQPELYASLKREVMENRLTGRSLVDVDGAYVCVDRVRPERHEVLLREMKIGGTLCLIDATGRIEGVLRAGIDNPAIDPFDLRSPALAIISLDGTEAKSTVLRWAESDSLTTWHAINFSTGHMLIDMDAQPRQHFIDNLELKTLAFVSSKHNPAHEALSDESDKVLCDISPDPKTIVPLDHRDAHDRIISFFTTETQHLSRSAQPFGKIVERLQASGAASTRLKMALSEYKLRQLCSTSEVFKAWEKLPSQRWYRVPDAFLANFRTVMRRLDGFGVKVDELRKVALDSGCAAGMKAYKYATSYGHEPHNIIFVIALFVMFFWLLLSLDTPALTVSENGRPARLGLLYSIDKFNPFTQMQLDRRHSQWQPNMRSLQIYVKFHRFIGFILCLLLAISVYTAARG